MHAPPDGDSGYRRVGASLEEVRMSQMRRGVALLLGLSIGGLAAAPARADGCRRVQAEINLAQGTIEGNFGLTGTVAFAGDSSGTPPATAPAGSSVFSGILTITTRRGVLTLRETGMFSSRTGNPAGSVLVSWGDSLQGTGRYEGVTGDLFFAGRRVEGVLLVDMVGELCRP
jgi:hypothetical protein